MQPIQSFDGDFHFLSNFSPCIVTWLGQSYPSVENAYQAAKVNPDNADPGVRTKLLKMITCGPGEAKKIGQTLPLQPNWDLVKMTVMRNLLAQKFKAGSEMANLLIATAPRRLIEGNWWGDTFWGVCKGQGLNMLGSILEEIRSTLMPADVITFTEAEIKYMQGCPEVLRALAMYHEIQQIEADSVMGPKDAPTGDLARQNQLHIEASRAAQSVRDANEALERIERLLA